MATVTKYSFDVRKSVHHHTIQTIQPRRCNSFTSLLLYIYVWLNTFQASPRPSSGAYNCTRSLWFNRWIAAAGALLVMVWETTTNNPIYYYFNPLNAELNPICYLLALLGAHHFLHVSRIRVK